MIENKRALFIGAHTDDVEIGCGGYLQRFKEKRIVAFSPAIEFIKIIQVDWTGVYWQKSK
jgi:hypothetical protein